ncbi:MAG: DNA polymerase III subunit beta [candidate division WOR-3 bacterium]
MRCALNREIFAEALGTVVSVLPSKATFPVYQNILLEVEQGRLAITGADGDTVVRREIKLEGKSEDGRVLVNGQRLNELVRASLAEQVSLKTTEKMMAMEADRMKADFTLLAPEEFPVLPELPSDIQFEFPLATLFDMYDLCSFAASRDESRPILTAINWEIGKGESRMVATDSIRLALVTRKVKSPVKAKLLLLPKALSIMPRGEERVSVFADAKRVGFKLENTIVVSRTIEGPYPEYERVIPKNLPARVEVKREQLINALRRAIIFASPVGKQVSIELTTKNMVLRVDNSDAGFFEEEIDCQHKGENLRVGFNGSYLFEILSHINTDEVAVELSSPMAPVVFKPVSEREDGEELFIMMPVRLD